MLSPDLLLIALLDTMPVMNTNHTPQLIDSRGVHYVEAGQPVPDWYFDPTTCGTCGRTWDDGVITSVTPAPSARCPFEDQHLTPTQQFFYDHAGWSYDSKTETPEQGRVRCALALGLAETWARAEGIFFSWDSDPEPYDGDDDWDGPVLICAAYRYGQESPVPLASLCGIAVPSRTDPYCRVVEAELALEIQEEQS